MVRIRAFENAAEIASQGGVSAYGKAADGTARVRGPLHLSTGQEAVPAGVCAHLKREDYLTSTHRGHGHTLAKGADLQGMMSELFGKATGFNGGKGGSMHIADLSKGMMGANGILGAGAPLICGAGLAAKFRGDGGVGITFFGDGAANQGTVLESMNLAAIWNLPVIFVIENNGYAEATSVTYATAVDSYVDRATGFGLPAVSVDGTDFFAVHKAAGDLIAKARGGGG
ncbi:MAG: thiamine pyrophosphate-dependent dehydrogenase E1 component subunit alpha, partial [Polaromonas sp.]|uniref:thiamine pyrophosphate-dependent dehydrogenase E1 component subunit alpha n=1 Tax=Polaromonas sp. TaxID=1869339 RepID=UPI002718A4B6